MEIKSLTTTDFDTIFEAFQQAFADYELQQDKEQLRNMLKRRGFTPELSFAAFEGKEIVAFTFNGIGSFDGIPTAYDTGTGTLKEYRGRGLATQIFEYSIPHLKDKGIKQYLLEVLQHNSKAVSVYRKLGFEVTREFNYFNQKNEEITIGSVNTTFQIKPINIENFPEIPAFWDFYPSWQNSFESVQRSLDGFVCLGAFSDEKLIGYCVFELASGDITQIAVDKEYRRKGIASMLLKEITKLNKYNSIKVINTDILCNSITTFLQSKNIAQKGTQFEMIKKL